MDNRLGLRAKDMMVTRVRTVALDERVYDVVRMLLKYNLTAAPVVGADMRFHGLLTEKNCIQALMRAVHDGLPSSHVRDVVTSPVVTVGPGEHLISIAHQFLSDPERTIPVVQRGRLVGIINRRDLLKAAVRVFDTAPTRESAVLYLSALERTWDG